MKFLKKTEAHIYHRHFSEDSFYEIKQLETVATLKIATYGPSGSLFSTIKFIIDELASKKTDIEIVYGIADFGKPEAKEKIKTNLDKLLKDKIENIRIFLHSRSHVKAIYADGSLYLGSQNVASTSKSLSELTKRSFDELFSRHEIILKVNDPEGALSNQILTDLQRDRFCCLPLDNSLELNENDFHTLEYWHDHTELIEHVKLIKNTIESYSDLTPSYDFSNELEIGELNEIIESLGEIFHEGSSDKSKEIINRLIKIVYGDSLLEASSEKKLCEFSEVLDLVSEIAESKPTQFDLDELEIVKDLIEPVDVFSLNDDDFEDIISDISNVISNAFATNKKSFLEKWEHEIVDYIASNPGDFDLSDYPIGDDSRVSDKDISNAISREFISLDTQINFLTPQINELASDTLGRIVSALHALYESKLIEAHEAVESIINLIEKDVDRFLLDHEAKLKKVW